MKTPKVTVLKRDARTKGEKATRAARSHLMHDREVLLREQWRERFRHDWSDAIMGEYNIRALSNQCIIYGEHTE